MCFDAVSRGRGSSSRLASSFASFSISINNLDLSDCDASSDANALFGTHPHTQLFDQLHCKREKERDGGPDRPPHTNTCHCTAHTVREEHCSVALSHKQTHTYAYSPGTCVLSHSERVSCCCFVLSPSISVSFQVFRQSFSPPKTKAAAHKSKQNCSRRRRMRKHRQKAANRRQRPLSLSLGARVRSLSVCCRHISN